MSNWIICPLRNGLHLTRAALKTFLAQDIGDIQVLFLDNSAMDGTGPWLRSIADDRVNFIYSNPPKSVAASWNTMLKWVFSTGAEYALSVNNDVELRPDTFRWLLADGADFVTAVGTTEKEKIAPPYLPPDPTKKRPHPDHSCFLIRKRAWDIVGPFDENFEGAYCEDLDNHIRLHKAGIKAEALELPFYHVKSATINTADQALRDEISAKAQRNRDYFQKKWGVGVGTEAYYEIFGAKGIAW